MDQPETVTPSIEPGGEQRVPALPRGLGVFVAMLAAVVLLSALAGSFAAVAQSPRVWFLLGFEMVIAVAAVFGVLLGLGRFSSGPALGIACVAGVIGTGSLLGYIAGRGNVGFDVYPFFLARVAASLAMAGAGGVAVLMRRPRVSVPRLLIGIGCVVGFAAVGAGAWKFNSAIASLGVVSGALVGLLLSVMLLGLLAAAVHLVIGAFEAGSADEPAPA